MVKWLWALPNRVAIALILGLAALTRWVGLGQSSVWHDEGYTMMLSAMPLAEIIERTGRDVHPPLYYLAIHTWSLIFGTSEIAVRGFSLVCGVGCVALIYVLVRRLMNERAGRLAALMVACGPFVIRYSQEARMYALVALLVTAASYVLVRALEGKAARWWVLYALLLAAALYTHYYAVFIIPVHIGYAWYRRGGLNHLLRDGRWWSANLAAAGLFALWLPVAYGQFSRVQGGFWIPEPTITTLPNSLLQLMTFTDLALIPPLLKVMLLAVVLGGLAAMLVRWRQHRQTLGLLAGWTLLPPLAVLAASLARPVYVDRYFVYSAVAAYALIGIAIAMSAYLGRRPRLQIASLALVLLIFGYGRFQVWDQSDHQMRTVGSHVSANYLPGDAVVSGELYTFFDFSYYNKSGQELQLLAPDGLTGYGESSLIYDRADQIVVRSLGDVRPASGRVWVVGKTGQHDYFNRVPSSWRQVGPPFEAGYAAARLYQVDSRPIAALQ